jgi:poly[(R)-3-hydroxyalkanoate] polymerase subunit PhaC
MAATTQPKHDAGDGAHLAGGAGAGLDSLLADATLSRRQRFVPGGALVRAAAGLARRPDRAARRATSLGAELARVAAGRSEVTPPKGDRRWADPAWQGSWLHRRVLQSYLATAQTLDELVDDAALDVDAERRLRFALENALGALAPSNMPLTNPAVLKAAIDTGGANFVRGARRLVRDLATPPRLPEMVDRSKFEVGENLAVTPGAVIARTEMYELIQYAPQTQEVRTTPLMIVPPMINKFYVCDLAPGRSMIEYFVGHGQTVFTLSWRNPGAEHADWDLDAYASSVLEALDTVQSVAGSEQAHLMALCSAGMVTSAAAAHMADRGDLDRVAGLALPVTVLDQAHAGTAGAFAHRDLARAAVADSARRGYVDGSALAGVFAWLRPNDLIWNYVVNNYLLGKDPPAFDILYWNSDAVRLAHGLHRDFMAIGLDNPLVEPGALEVLGSPVDLRRVDVDAYHVAAVADHICPWQNCYTSTALLGGRQRFVLSTSGHIAAMVNPPGNEKASFHVSDGPFPASAEEWHASAPKHRGTWWADYDAWLAERSGPLRPAPDALGDADHPPLADAPGEYVLAA